MLAEGGCEAGFFGAGEVDCGELVVWQYVPKWNQLDFWLNL